MSNQPPLLTQSPQKTDISVSFWDKYKNYIILGSISVIIFGIIGYFIYKKFKKSGGEKVDCQLSDWIYTDCICDSGSSNGYVYRTQNIIKEAENGGIACPSPDQLKQVVRYCSCSDPTGTTIPPTGTTIPPTGTTVPPTGTTVPPHTTTIPPHTTTMPPHTTTIPPHMTTIPPTGTTIPPTGTTIPPHTTTMPYPSVTPSLYSLCCINNCSARTGSDCKNNSQDCINCLNLCKRNPYSFHCL